MLRLIIGAAAVAALILVPRAIEPASAAQDVPLTGVNRQPILICDASGDTWHGPTQSTVLVWSDGDVCFSWKDPQDGFAVGSMKLSPKALRTLVSELEAADAWVLPDQWPHVMDVPLLTVTVLDPTADARAHTFSYWLGAKQYQAVDALMDRLLQEVHRVN